MNYKSFINPIINECGTKYWFDDNKLHRDDGPAVIYSNGNVEFWFKGNRIYCKTNDHFLSTIPLIPSYLEFEELSYGSEFYFDDDNKLHCDDGPALIYRKQNIFHYSKYFHHGKLHRANGPAFELLEKHKEWYLNDELHRVDGPAIEISDGYKVWYINGKLHRIDGPAIERRLGTKEWYVNGKRHRVDGPAIISANGNKEWWIDGKRHRLDGPAIELDSCNMYFIEDIRIKCCSNEEFLRIVKMKELL
jgi:hypothetical protein